MLFILINLIVLIGIAIQTYNFLSGRNWLCDAIDQLRINRRSLSFWDDFWVANPNQSDVIICLTTTPIRIAHIAATLKSLMSQTRRPQKIRLHIPDFSTREQCSYEIPAELKNLQSVEIIPCQDFGPATKLIPALQEFILNQNLAQQILIVDDDMVYPRNMVENFYHWAHLYPNWAIGSSGWIVPQDLTDRPTTLVSNIKQLPPTPIKSTRIRQRKEIDILQGYSGFMVQPCFFNLEEITDYANKPEAAFYVDDVWISAHCHAPKYVLPAERYCWEVWGKRSFFKENSLGRINRGNGDHEKRNNTIMIRHFKDRWLNQQELS